MHEYRVTGVKDAQFNKTDRDKISINLSTDQGPVTLAIGMSDLENLIGCLHHVEHAVSLLDPAKGTVARGSGADTAGDHRPPSSDRTWGDQWRA